MREYVLNLLKKLFLIIHRIALRFHILIIPDHYYSSMPNLNELKNTKNLWARKSELPGINTDMEKQIANISKICEKYKNEWEGNKFYKEGVENRFGPGYGYIEAQALHSVIRYYKPSTIIEVGSGISTYCMLSALKMNKREKNKKITAIEPFPYSALENLIEENTEIELISKKIQEIPYDLFDKLNENDLLFIDSSHTVKTGSDVNYLILEILPRLKPGVLVHFHDIYLPFDYQTDVLKTFFHWSETSLLRAFLINNNNVEIIFCMSMLHHEREEELKNIFGEYDPQKLVNGLDDRKPFESTEKHFPASIYLKVTN